MERWPAHIRWRIAAGAFQRSSGCGATRGMERRRARLRGLRQARGAPVYLYFFSRVGAGMEARGAFHGSDVPTRSVFRRATPRLEGPLSMTR